MNLKQLQTDPTVFRSALLVDTDSGPKRLADVCDRWQADDFAALDPAWRRVAGHDAEPKYQRAWLERGRGHSKTTDIAVSAAWVLFASRRKLNGVACAADKDQAALIRDAIDRLLRLNPWLADILECQATKIVNKHTGSVLTILSADVASSYGLLIDFCIVDELTHWPKRDLWDSIFSAIAKRRHALLLVIANAGFRDSWQWELREMVREFWYFHRLNGPVASWISQEHLDEQRRLLPAKVYSRLWGNQWCDGSGDALEVGDIDAALKLDRASLPERGWIYTLGCDIGLTHDCTALALVGRHVGYSEPILIRRRQPVGTLAALQDLDIVPAVDSPAVEYRRVPGSERLKLCRLDIWRPVSGKVDLTSVENRIAELHRQYGLSRVTADPWQAELMLQRLTRQGVPCEGLAMSGTTLQALATSMLTEFRGRTIDLMNEPTLAADLRNLRVASRSYGFRLESPTNANGHGDTCSALGLAIRAARQTPLASVFAPTRQLVYN